MIAIVIFIKVCYILFYVITFFNLWEIFHFLCVYVSLILLSDISIEVLNVPTPPQPTAELKNPITDLISSDKLERQTSSSTSSYWGDIVEDVDPIEVGSLAQKLTAVSGTDSNDEFPGKDITSDSEHEALDKTSDTIESNASPVMPANTCIKNLKENNEMDKSCDTITGTSDDLDDWGDWDEPTSQNSNVLQNQKDEVIEQSVEQKSSVNIEEPISQNTSDSQEQIDSVVESSVEQESSVNVDVGLDTREVNKKEDADSTCHVKLPPKECTDSVVDLVEGQKQSETVDEDEEDSCQSIDQDKLSPSQSKSIEMCESSSMGSWMSIDDVIKVKKQKGETRVDAARRSSEGDSNETSGTIRIFLYYVRENRLLV